MTPPNSSPTSSKQPPKIILLSPKALLPGRLAHPWVFRSDLKKIITDQAGVVEVKSPQGKRLDDALYSPQKKGMQTEEQKLFELIQKNNCHLDFLLSP